MSGNPKKSLYRLLRGGWFVATFIAFVVPTSLFAAVSQGLSGTQVAPDPSGVPRVTVGKMTATPGEEMMVPLYFTANPKVPVRAFTVEIDYVSNSLKFQKAAKGVAAETAGIGVSTALTEGTPDDKGITRSKLRVSATPEEATQGGQLPEGLLAYLLFEVSPQAKLFSISLNLSIVSAEDINNPPQKVANVYAQSGEVVIETFDVMPQPTCFFFSH